MAAFMGGKDVLGGVWGVATKSKVILDGKDIAKHKKSFLRLKT
jgi:hypothetical protein